VRCLLMSCLGGLRTCKPCPPVLRHTLPEKGFEEVDIQVDIIDCLRLDVTASLRIAGFCMGSEITHFHDSSLLLKLLCLAEHRKSYPRLGPNVSMIQAFYQALQISVSLGTCI
jgi:hypothetical protein